MAETIHLLGSLGEFIVAIAVVLTLIYLAIQVRHGSALLEADNAAMDEPSRRPVKAPRLSCFESSSRGSRW
jgi:hypothetical protein